METLTRSVDIDPRFNGPPESANGGYACGRLAAFIPGPAEVTLRKPPPLGTTMEVTAGDDGGVLLLHGESLIAQGRPAAAPTGEPPVRPSFEQALAARSRHPGNGVRHALSGCFVCGPERGAAGDGLWISPGAIEGAGDVGAAPFVPDESLADVDGVVRPEIVWAALDCPSYAPSMWASDRISLLGRMTAALHRDVQVGERLVAVGWMGAVDGRKRFTASALIDESGATVARAAATWIELTS